MTKFAQGMQGQNAAKEHLVKKGYAILYENYRLRSSEIDIIAKDRDYYVFIEVKYRKGLAYGLPREAVGYYKQKQIIKAAMHYIVKKNLNNSNFRFDVVEILEMDGKAYINHIVDAFHA